MPDVRSARSLGFLALVALSLSATNVHATPVTVEIATTVDSYVAASHTLPIAFGDDVVIRFTYDDAVADTDATDGIGQFLDNLIDLSVEFPDSALLFSWSGGQSLMSTTDDTPTVLPTVTVYSDTLVLGSVTGPVSGLLDGDTVDAISLGFAQAVFGGMPTMVVDDLPNPPFQFDGLGVSTIIMQGFIGQTPYADAFNLAGGSGSVVVPEPGVAALMLVATVGLAPIRRRTG